MALQAYCGVTGSKDIISRVREMALLDWLHGEKRVHVRNTNLCIFNNVKEETLRPLSPVQKRYTGFITATGTALLAHYGKNSRFKDVKT